jgi:hypothetical protein
MDLWLMSNEIDKSRNIPGKKRSIALKTGLFFKAYGQIPPRGSFLKILGFIRNVQLLHELDAGLRIHSDISPLGRDDLSWLIR